MTTCAYVYVTVLIYRIMITGACPVCNLRLLTAILRCDILKKEFSKRRFDMPCKSKGPCGTAKKTAAKTPKKPKK